MQISHRLRRLAVALLLISLSAGFHTAGAAQRTQEANVVGVVTFALPPEELQESVPKAVRDKMLLATDGNIYFTSSQGGTGYGNIASLAPDGTTRLVYEFVDGDDGYSPFAGLIQASDGNLYGTTYYGGPDREGSVFKLTLAGELSTLHDFAKGGAEGRDVYTAVVQAADGNLYGTTRLGGEFGKGTIYRIAPDGSGFAVLHSFNGDDGQDPQGQLVEDSDGLLYGTTMLGGSDSRGVIYRISTAGEFQRLYSFPRLSAFNALGLATNSTGANPRAGLLRTADGVFYGTAYQGGVHGNGTLYRAEIAGDLANVTVVHAFEGWSFDAGFPVSSVVQGPDGDFYGTSESGGYSDNGAVWRVAQDGSSFAMLHGYAGTATDGKSPYASPLFANGNLYVVSTTDNSVGAGAIVRLETETGGVLPVELTTSAREIDLGESVQLSWSAPNAVTCDKFSSWNEAADETDPEHITPTSGTKTVTPGAGVYTYGLSCADASNVIHNALVGLVVNPPPLKSVDGGKIIGGGEFSWLLLALLAALLFVKIFKENRCS
jgi:uncharacterized repeat protein (TIGR03803 family)